MIEHDFYELVCICGEALRTTAREGVCKKCGRPYIISWPAVLPTKEQKKEPEKVEPPEE